MKSALKITAIFILSALFIALLPHTQASSSATNYNLVTRKQWGANEDLRLYNPDNPTPDIIILEPEFYLRYASELKLQKIVSRNESGEKLTWPLEYPEKVSKIFIHHTGSSNNLDDPKKLLRSIYKSHAMTRGWGDIGYNYIIDTKGNVYEGRYGGEGVVGAHVGPMGNRGSIGIAIMGNYNEDEMTQETKNALVALLSDKTKLYGIDPAGSGYFRGVYLPNITGHESVMETSCPGKNISKILSEIRQAVAKNNGLTDYTKNGTRLALEDFSFEYIPVLNEITMPADRKMQYTVQLKNTGKKTWDSSTRITLMNDPLVKRSFIIGTSKINEQTVAPGEIGTFKITIQSKLYGGFNYIRLRPFFNGGTLSEDAILIPAMIENPKFDYEVIGLSIPRNSLSVGETLTAVVRLKNTGNVSWKNYGPNRISIGSSNPTDRKSLFTESTRMGFLKESVVKPGEIGNFVFRLKAPLSSGFYNEYFAPVVENITWLNGKNMKFSLEVI